MLKTAEIIAIGDELLIGQTLDTNSQWICQQMDAIGVKVKYASHIGDNQEDILDSLEVAQRRSDYVFITGGLGPTKDDITKKTLAYFFDTPLVLDEERLKELETFFASRGKTMNDLNKTQAIKPEGCWSIHNSCGTANGMWFEQNHKIFISMPGVPYEMKAMMSDIVIPKIKETLDQDAIIHRTIKTIGIGESDLSILIEDWEDNLPEEIKLAYLPSLGQVKLRLSTSGSNATLLNEILDSEIEKLKPLIKKYIYSYSDEESFEEFVLNRLSAKKLTISTAESCTGGKIASTITSIPGCSSIFMGSVVAYSNSIKINMLNVNSETIKNHGAVSEQTVTEMAQNVRTLLKSDIAIATSGIAGPNGGSEEKPVGTIWIAFADDKKTVTKKLQLSNNRLRNIQLTTISVLNLIRENLN